MPSSRTAPSTKTMPFTACTLALLAAATAPDADAELVLGTPFSDHMVVQIDAPLRVYGTDDPGTAVTATFGGATAEATTGDDGRFEIELPTVAADDAAGELVVEGTTRVALDDVTPGEVWWCSGQSNMEWVIQNSNGKKWVLRQAPDPGIRMLSIPRQTADAPLDRVDAQWQIAGPDTLPMTSAVAYFFARDLKEKTGRTVGVVVGAWGGTRVQSWLPEARFEGSPHAPYIVDRYAKDSADYQKRLGKWRRNGKKGRRPFGRGGAPQDAPAVLANGMTLPLGPMPVRGVLWYQGESDTIHPEIYGDLFEELTAAWREQFRDPDLPVYFVQLPEFKSGNSDERWAEFREAQQAIAATPDDGVDMAVALGLGEADNVHPRNKKGVAERLSAMVMHDHFGAEAPGRGPRPTGAALGAGGAVRVSFAPVAGSLKPGASADGGFQLIDAAGNAHTAEVEVVDGGSAVRVSAAGVDAPAAVRYAHAAVPEGGLTDASGLPAPAFRFDVQGAGD